MSNEMLLKYLQIFIGLAGLLYLWQWRFKAYRIDLLRENLFELRKEIFEAARTGKIGFEMPTYRIITNTLNGFIRFGHRLTFLQVLLTIIVFKKTNIPDKLKFNSRYHKSLHGLNKEQMQLFNDYKQRMNLIVLTHVMGSPFIFITCVLPIICLVLLIKGYKGCALILKGAVKFRKRSHPYSIHRPWQSGYEALQGNTIIVYKLNELDTAAYAHSVFCNAHFMQSKENLAISA